jgi:hypothetical protein
MRAFTAHEMGSLESDPLGPQANPLPELGSAVHWNEGSARRYAVRYSTARPIVIGARLAHVLERRSRYVMIPDC